MAARDGRDILAGIGAASLMAGLLLARRWQRWKRLPAVSEETRRVGLRGLWIGAGPHVMFTRVANGPAGAATRLPVVLVHGLVVSSRYMEPLAAELARRFRVLAPDLPGFGDSDKPRRILDVTELADALALWLRSAGIPRAMFVANSFGCQILAELALRHPQRVERLVLQGPTTDPDARSLPRQIWRDLVNGRREPRAMGPIARVDYAKAGLRRALATARMCVRDRIEDKLPAIAAPTLVLAGSRDPVVPLAWARRVAHLLPHGRLVILEGGTHTLNYSYPRSFAAAILPFLAGETKSSAPTKATAGEPTWA
jgi:pimeloyl-ACP methyl ester carboxylesterase